MHIFSKGFLFLSSLGKQNTFASRLITKTYVASSVLHLFQPLCVCVRTKKCIFLFCFVANAIWFACYKIHFVSPKEILWVNPDSFFFNLELLILPFFTSCWEWKTWNVPDGEREDRCLEDVRTPTLCVPSSAELLFILKTVSLTRCKCCAS